MSSVKVKARRGVQLKKEEDTLPGRGERRGGDVSLGQNKGRPLK